MAYLLARGMAVDRIRRVILTGGPEFKRQDDRDVIRWMEDRHGYREEWKS